MTATAVHAWGSEGHRIVAEAAERQLTPAAISQVQRLLALEPGETLSSISTWADEVRTPTTAAWHYVNFHQGQPCTYERSLCPDGQCVIEAIQRQAAILASRAPDDQRLKALKYLVHFVADIHQPLHAGFAEDRGGNRYQVQAFGRGTNLHSLWDSGLIDHRPGDADELLQAVARQGVQAGNMEPWQWAEAACRIVRAPGFYPDSHQLPSNYAARWDSTLVGELGKAAARLAALLNERLGAAPGR